MGGIKDLILLYLVDLFVPGSETLLIFTAAAHGRSAGLGVVCGLSAMTLACKVAAALGVATLGCLLEQVVPAMRVLGAFTFILFAVYLFWKAWMGKVGKLAYRVRESRNDFGRWFGISVACVGVNPFTIAATLSLIAVATACDFSPQEGVQIACILSALNMTWNVILLFLSRTIFARIVTRPMVLRSIYFVASGIFCFYSWRFFAFAL